MSWLFLVPVLRLLVVSISFLLWQKHQRKQPKIWKEGWFWFTVPEASVCGCLVPKGDWTSWCGVGGGAKLPLKQETTKKGLGTNTAPEGPQASSRSHLLSFYHLSIVHQIMNLPALTWWWGQSPHDQSLPKVFSLTIGAFGVKHEDLGQSKYYC